MITKKQFALFKKEHQKWCDAFGLFPWKMSYHIGTSSKFRGAWNMIEFENQLCHVYLDRNFEKEDHEKNINEALKIAAKHEAIHILLAPLYIPCMERFIDEDTVNRANEDLVRRLETLIA
jgi:hypothetical protein